MKIPAYPRPKCVRPNVSRRIRLYLTALTLLPATSCGGGTGESSEEEGGFLPDPAEVDELFRQYQDLCAGNAVNYASQPDCGVAGHPEQVIPGSCLVGLCPASRYMESCPGDPEGLSERAEMLRGLLEKRQCNLRVHWQANPFSGGEPLECDAIVRTFSDDYFINPLEAHPETKEVSPECAVRETPAS